MTDLDIPSNGRRSPDLLATWEKDGMVHRLMRVHYPPEWRAEKRKPTSKNWTPYFWTKAPRQLNLFREENGI